MLCSTIVPPCCDDRMVVIWQAGAAPLRRWYTARGAALRFSSARAGVGNGDRDKGAGRDASVLLRQVVEHDIRGFDHQAVPRASRRVHSPPCRCNSSIWQIAASRTGMMRCSIYHRQPAQRHVHVEDQAVLSIARLGCLFARKRAAGRSGPRRSAALAISLTSARAGWPGGAIERQVGVAKNGGEQVVEIVRDAAGGWPTPIFCD